MELSSSRAMLQYARARARISPSPESHPDTSAARISMARPMNPIGSRQSRAASNNARLTAVLSGCRSACRMSLSRFNFFFFLSRERERESEPRVSWKNSDHAALSMRGYCFRSRRVGDMFRHHEIDVSRTSLPVSLFARAASLENTAISVEILPRIHISSPAAREGSLLDGRGAVSLN